MSDGKFVSEVRGMYLYLCCVCPVTVFVFLPGCVCFAALRGIQPAGRGVLLDPGQRLSQRLGHAALGPVQHRELLYFSV